MCMQPHTAKRSKTIIFDASPKQFLYSFSPWLSNGGLPAWVPSIFSTSFSVAFGGPDVSFGLSSGLGSSLLSIWRLGASEKNSCEIKSCAKDEYYILTFHIFAVFLYALLRCLVPQVVKVQLPSATNWRDFIYFFVIAVPWMFTSMMRKYMFARQNCYIKASLISIYIVWEKYKNIIFQDYYYQNETGKSHLLFDEWIY